MSVNSVTHVNSVNHANSVNHFNSVNHVNNVSHVYSVNHFNSVNHVNSVNSVTIIQRGATSISDGIFNLYSAWLYTNTHCRVGSCVPSNDVFIQP